MGTACDRCYNGESCSNKKTGGCSGKNVCNPTCQTVCETEGQLIKNVIGPYPGKDKEIISGEDIIADIWSVDFFTKLNDQLKQAEKKGTSKKQGSTGSFNNPKPNDIITAEFYNNVQQKLSGFNVNYSKVNVNDLITAARANAIRNAYNSAKFNSSTCETCNTGENDCSCNCPCSCSCSCSCSCGCQCQCSCSSPEGD